MTALLFTIMVWCPRLDTFYDSQLSKEEAVESDYYQNNCVEIDQVEVVDEAQRNLVATLIEQLDECTVDKNRHIGRIRQLERE